MLASLRTKYFTVMCPVHVCVCMFIYVVHMCEGACVCIVMRTPEVDVVPLSCSLPFFLIVEVESVS